MAQQQRAFVDRPNLRVRVRSVVSALLLGLVLLVAGAATASAHATLEGTDPADGTVLPTSPASVSLAFTEAVSLQPRGIRVLDASGEPVLTEAAVVDRRAEVTFPDTLANGTYVVSWRVTSVDGHPISGAFDFSVGEATPVEFVPADPEPSTPLTRTLQVTNGLAYAGLLLTIGIAAFLVLVAPAEARSLDRARGQLLRLVRPTAALALLGSAVLAPVLTLWQEAGRIDGLTAPATWAESLTVTTLAPPVLVAVGLALVLVGLHRSHTPTITRPHTPTITRSHTPTIIRSTQTLVVVGSVVALTSVVVSGHTRAAGPWIAYPVDLVHVGAAALWLGSVVALVVISRRSSGAKATDVATAVGSFSALALETVIVLAAAGTLMTWLILDSPAELVTSAWGIALIVKVALVAVIVAMAAFNRWRLLPAVVSETDEIRAWTHLRRSLRIEAVALVAVVAVTGVLVTQSPRVDALPVPAPVEQTLRGTVPAGEGVLSYSLDPVLRGANTVRFRITEPDGTLTRSSAAPTLQTSYLALGLGPFTHAVSEVEPGTYEAVPDLDYAGQWVVQVGVRVDKFTSVPVQFTVDIP